MTAAVASLSRAQSQSVRLTTHMPCTARGPSNHAAHQLVARRAELAQAQAHVHQLTQLRRQPPGLGVGVARFTQSCLQRRFQGLLCTRGLTALPWCRLRVVRGRCPAGGRQG